ncbi:OB-fold protein [Paracnuella aquatica]|uniref:OB-fold protein n=1 Tax=Paracnuella aquatica TaxID=2268757 RepID=UPI00138FD2DC|nr:hypothetical protein [Paracnuella aquatica]
MKKYMGYGIALMFILVVLWGYRMFSQKVPDVVQARPDVVIHATEMTRDFNVNSAEVNQKYGNKIIRVTGTVTQVNQSGSVILGSGSDGSEIVIGLDQRHQQDVQKVTVGMQAVFQALYTGYEAGGVDKGDDLLSSLGATIHLRSGGLIKEN